MRELLIRFVTFLFGGVCLAVYKLARRAEVARQLKHCDQVGARIAAGHDLVVDNRGYISIGAEVSLMNRCLLNTYEGGAIHIGSNCFIGDNCKIISDKGKVVVGDGCLIAEDVVIRAANHGIRKGIPIREQDNSVRDVIIGADVWIGRGVTVLPGANIADGCVIGANSVVRGTTEANSIYAGIPIQKLRIRPEASS